MGYLRGRYIKLFSMQNQKPVVVFSREESRKAICNSGEFIFTPNSKDVFQEAIKVCRPHLCGSSDFTSRANCQYQGFSIGIMLLIIGGLITMVILLYCIIRLSI